MGLCEDRLGSGFAGLVRPSYPHMLVEDRGVWSRWLEVHGAVVGRCWYDVHVGEAVPVPVGLGPEIEAVSLGVTRKRIDVVALVGGVYWVVEVKPYGSQTALGQVLNYSRLFTLEFGPEKMVQPVVVCCAVDPDLAADFGRFGVRVEEVGYGT
jgi:hypothetical protein